MKEKKGKTKDTERKADGWDKERKGDIPWPQNYFVLYPSLSNMTL